MTAAWTEWSLTDEAPDGWSHHGLALLADGTVVGYHPGERRLLFFDRDGALVRSAPCEALEAHDIAVADEGLWLADCGTKLCRVDGGAFGGFESVPPNDDAQGQVLLVDLDGCTLRAITSIDHPSYAAGGLFLPTGVAVDDRGLWIADGYGSNLVHLVGHDGERLLTLDGFYCPHGIAIDRRREEPLLYVAERGAHRLCVYDLDGTFVRHAGVGDLIAPCSIATVGSHLAVADLVSRVTVLDLDDELVAHLGGDREATGRPGWPNAMDDGGTMVAPRPEAGRFNSPHGVVADADGNLYVTEWLLGGRWVRCPAP
jgi:hypothetical protein